MVGQDVLRKLFRESVAARGLALEDVAAYVDGRWQRRQPPDGASALVVLRRFDPAEYVRGSAAFVARLGAAERERWYRAFTRSTFLVGNPSRLAERHGALLTHRTDDVAWAWSPDDRSTRALRRLLKPLRTRGPATLAPEVRCDLGGGPEKEIRVATEGLPLERYLVHLNHTLCEALIAGLLGPADGLTLRHVPEVTSLPEHCPYVRVVPDDADPDRLAAVAYVAEPEER